MEKMDMTNPEGVIRYTPSFQEELTGVRLIGMIHTTGLRAIIETVILLVAAGLFLSSYIREQDGNALFFALVCLVLIVVVWLVPELAMRRMARERAGRTICIRLAPEGIFRILSNGESRAFLYDGLVAEQEKRCVAAAGREKSPLSTAFAGDPRRKTKRSGRSIAFDRRSERKVNVWF